MLKSYLSERTFHVKIADEISDICEIKAGIPQGSVLGPILYTIFTYDVPVNDDITLASYADDTAILYSDQSSYDASVIVQRELDILQIWLKRSKIEINTQKCNHVTFTLNK